MGVDERSYSGDGLHLHSRRTTLSSKVQRCDLRLQHPSLTASHSEAVARQPTRAPWQVLRRLCSPALVLLLMTPALAAAGDSAGTLNSAAIIAHAQSLKRLHSLLVLHHGQPMIEHVQDGPGLNRPANIKSLSKTILAALAGVAIHQGVLESADQPMADLLGSRVPAGADPRLQQITLGHALAMQTGLQSTSGRNYGRWVRSEDWLAHVLTRPFIDEPGGRMIYSSGATHLVSAALVEATGRSTLELARAWLGEPLNIHIPDWMTDPQGVHFGGNEMLLSPRALARIGELYRQGGVVDGRRVLPESWIRESWRANGSSPWTGDAYGFGWFLTDLAGQKAYYGRGYGGQLLMVVPGAGLTIVVTSDPWPPSPGGRYFDQLRALATQLVRGSDC